MVKFLELFEFRVITTKLSEILENYGNPKSDIFQDEALSMWFKQ